MWNPFKRSKPPQANPRRTRDLSPEALSESAKRQDLFALFELFLIRRVEADLALEEKKAEIRMKTAEADAQTKLKLEEIRQQRKQLKATQAAERNRTYPRDRNGRLLPRQGLLPGQTGCPVCLNPSDAGLTVEMIRAHHAAGHGNGSISSNGN